MTRKPFTNLDRDMMLHALTLARRGLGRVEPNPLVGCVIVRGSRILGEGYHARFGGAHAEVAALRRAGGLARGATAYVTLEPCAHFGKTPPCTTALIESGVRRVVVAMGDPNGVVAGRGFRALRAAGIIVRRGCCRAEAEELNKAYVAFSREHRPFVILKWAQSVDGHLSTPRGQSSAISGGAAHRWVHRLRGRVDAIVVGINTVLSDDPRLTARDVPRRRIAARVVLDSHLRVPSSCRLVRSARQTPTLVLTTPSAIVRRRRFVANLARAGVEVEPCRSDRGHVDFKDAVAKLWRRNMTNVVIEGGPTVLTAAMAAGVVDEAYVFVAPRLIGGRAAPVILDPAVALSASAVPRRIGADVLYHFDLR